MVLPVIAVVFITVQMVHTLWNLELRGRAAESSRVAAVGSSGTARSCLGVAAERGNRTEKGTVTAGDGRHGASSSAVSICR